MAAFFIRGWGWRVGLADFFFFIRGGLLGHLPWNPRQSTVEYFLCRIMNSGQVGWCTEVVTGADLSVLLHEHREITTRIMNQ